MFYIIKSGFVSVMKDDIDEIPTVLITRGYFGELEVLENCNRKYTIKAMVDSEIYYADAAEVKRLFAEDYSLFDQFSKLAKEREA